MLYFLLWCRNWLLREDGQDLIEYALLVGLLSLVCIAAITLAGESLSGMWTTIEAAVSEAAAGIP